MSIEDLKGNLVNLINNDYKEYVRLIIELEKGEKLEEGIFNNLYNDFMDDDSLTLLDYRLSDLIDNDLREYEMEKGGQEQ